VREPDAAAGCIRTVRMRPTALLACAALGGCAADAREARDEPAIEPRAAADARAEPDVRAGIVVTRDDPSLPAACRPRALATRIGRFLDAVSRGDPAAARFVAPSGGWYSVTEGRARHFVAYERRELAEHLARRHDRGERVRLLDLAVGFANGLGQIEFRLDRRAGRPPTARRGRDDRHRQGRRELRLRVDPRMEHGNAHRPGPARGPLALPAAAEASRRGHGGMRAPLALSLRPPAAA
jgi:hypothetical protein